jgi:hypothetical protein
MAAVALGAQARVPANDHGARPERVPVGAVLRSDLDDGHAVTVARGADNSADADAGPRRKRGSASSCSAQVRLGPP